jgi:hypothetical protein
MSVASLLACALATAALVVALTRDSDLRLDRIVRATSSGEDSAPVKEQLVFCPKGYVSIGGGGNVPHGNDTPGVAIFWSAPFENGWRVEAQDTRRQTRPWVLSAIVVCARGRDVDTGGGSLPPDTSG